jgi:hypothetical protein
MGISFGKPPSMPQYFTSEAFHIDLFVGFLVTILTAFASDRLGTYMYRKGYAKPFFVLGHRLHHSRIAALIPICYLIFAYFMITGNIQLIRDLLWYRIALIPLFIGLCFAVDFFGDKEKVISTGVLRHEWIYVVIPVYIFAFVVNVFV